MRVLVTGHRGYIGSVASAVLRHARYEVMGLDCDFFEGCDFGRQHETIPSYESDIRDIEYTDLLPFDAVIHLAGLTDDTSAAIDPDLMKQVNLEATIRLALNAKRAGVTRFVFASSCSLYGRSGPRYVNEQSSVQPLSPYAASKLACEQAFAQLADDRFVPTSLRFGTVYGISPRLRLDTVVNDFVAAAITQEMVNMQTIGAGWRPLVHVEDVARAIVAVLQAPDENVHNQVFNVVPPDGNFQVIDIADAVTEVIPRCKRQADPEIPDTLSYRVDGQKLIKHTSIVYRWNLERGIRQLYLAMAAAGLTPGLWRSNTFRRALHLNTLYEQHRLDRKLRKITSAVA